MVYSYPDARDNIVNLRTKKTPLDEQTAVTLKTLNLFRSLSTKRGTRGGKKNKNNKSSNINSSGHQKRIQCQNNSNLPRLPTVSLFPIESTSLTPTPFSSPPPSQSAKPSPPRPSMPSSSSESSTSHQLPIPIIISNRSHRTNQPQPCTLSDTTIPIDKLSKAPSSLTSSSTRPSLSTSSASSSVLSTSWSKSLLTSSKSSKSQSTSILPPSSQSTSLKLQSTQSKPSLPLSSTFSLSPRALISVPRLTTSPTQPKNLNVHYFNARSCANKPEDVYDFIVTNNVDILFITETWLRENGDEPVIAAMTPPSYKFQSKPRKDRRGGGIAIVYKESLEKHITISTHTTYLSFESMSLQLVLNGKALNFVCLYRPPPSPSNTISLSIVREEMCAMFSDMATKPGEPVILGDFNFHSPTDGRASELQDVLDQNNMRQIVRSPTHQHGNIIDWVVVSNSTSSVFEVKVSDVPFSDHYPIKITMDVTKPQPTRANVTSRNMRSIDVQSFRSDLKEALSDLNQTSASMEDFNSRVSDVVNLHAPLTTRNIPHRRFSPWFNDQVKAAKTKCRQAERTWVKSRQPEHEAQFRAARREWRNILRHRKSEYYISKLEESKSCSQKFSICNELLGKSKTSSLPNSVSDLPEEFSNYFEEKIVRIRDKFECHDCVLIEKTFKGIPFDNFTPVTEDFVQSLILKAPKKSCELDPFPHSLLPICLDLIVPPITSIINNSLTNGTVPECMKEALVRPLLKKPSLNKNELKNYRPVSNLSFVSKILEKVVLLQMLEHIRLNDMHHRFQSAYRVNHSTETALLKVVNDLVMEADANRCNILCLLDLSAAFDTIDHDILIARLENMFGVRGTALSWFNSYLRERRQSVVVEGVKSNVKRLKYGVPQGSVLGPVLFTLYMQPLADVVAKHGINHHIYADDTQLYASTSPSNILSLKSALEACLTDVKCWTNTNKLMLNDDKTEALLVGRSCVLKSVDLTSIQCGDSEIFFSPFVKSLGVLIDSTLSFNYQVTNVIRQLNIELRRIRQIRNLISTETAKTLISSLVLSKLDYCNSLLANITKDKIKSMQITQNNAARLVFKKPKFHSVSFLLRELHWLPVDKRILYKLCSLVYKSLNTQDPPYIREMLNVYTPARSLRSENDKFILTKPMPHRKIGEQSFAFSAPHSWNSLPEDLRCSNSLSTFKRGLKTHLFVS